MSRFAIIFAVLSLLVAAHGMSSIGAQAATAAKGKFAIFSPETFTVKDLEPAKVKIRLIENPGAVTATVFLEADGVLFDKCRLDFTGQNYNKEQEVTIYPKATFEAGKQHKSIFGARLAWVDNPSGSHNTIQSITFTRDVRKGRLCQANGDPHYVTFDNRGFDFFKKCTQKAYVLFKSPQLYIISQHGPWDKSHNNAVNSAIAFAYGKTVYVVDGRKKGEDRLKRISPSNRGVQVETKKKGKEYDAIDFFMSDGAQLHLKFVDNSIFGSYINVDVVVPACYFQKTSGLCGVYDDKKENDFTKPDGRQAANEMEFGESWAVPDNDNIFIKSMSARVINTLQDHPPTVSCTFPADFNTAGLTPAPIGYDIPAVAQTEYAVDPPVPVQPQAQDPSRGDAPFKTYVTQVCTEVITVPGLDKIPMLPTNLISSNIDYCIKDCQLSGTVEPVESYRVAVMRAANAVASGAMEKFKICEATGQPRPRTITEIEQFAEQIGLGVFKCMTNCSGRGLCEAFGCSCQQGWAGKDCSVDMKAKAAGIPPRPAQHVAYAA